MQTRFTSQQLSEPDMARSNEVLRACVHCGFCIATCPTYQVLGDELDSPRGRIYQLKDMLENEREPDPRTVKHIDRCLSCLACMTTCPSGVHYMHLVDHGRKYINEHYRRPAFDRMLRWTLAQVLPYPARFRLAMRGARLARPFRKLLPDARLRAMLEMAPASLPKPSDDDRPQVFAAAGRRRKRVALMTGCAQRALNPDINEATIRLLRRHGCEVVVAQGIGCCGALTHHMGDTESSHRMAADNIRAWTREIDGDGLDAIVINASGCGTTVKDYGHMLRTDEALADEAARVSSLTTDISELMSDLGLVEANKAAALRVAYHSACSLQHGQRVTSAPKALLKQAGFEVQEPRDAHLCCGSAGTYNLMQPEIASELKRRKVATLEDIEPEVVATGNIGCLVQLDTAMTIPVVHTVELLDWATGGPVPRALDAHGVRRRDDVAGPTSDTPSRSHAHEAA